MDYTLNEDYIVNFQNDSCPPCMRGSCAEFHGSKSSVLGWALYVCKDLFLVCILGQIDFVLRSYIIQVFLLQIPDTKALSHLFLFKERLCKRNKNVCCIVMALSLALGRQSRSTARCNILTSRYCIVSVTRNICYCLPVAYMKSSQSIEVGRCKLNLSKWRIT